MSHTLQTPNRASRRGALGAALALVLSGCAREEPAVERRLLVIDGIEITFDELKPYVDFIDTFEPETGTKTKHVWVMRDYLLPLKVARRTFAKEREEQRKLAEGLRSVADNVAELERQAELIKHKARRDITRKSAFLPVAMWAFDPLNTLAVSPPLELPAGWFVVGVYDFHESPMVTTDYVDALQVGFVTHTSKEWRAFWEAEKQRIGDKVTFVHPDYRDDLPKWMTPPQEKP
ncbi:MAG TPA: hypothetical protein ENI87_02330 [bacterium]|nr:hypothetical protein [bacterium]